MGLKSSTAPASRMLTFYTNNPLKGKLNRPPNPVTGFLIWLVLSWRWCQTGVSMTMTSAGDTVICAGCVLFYWRVEVKKVFKYWSSTVQSNMKLGTLRSSCWGSVFVHWFSLNALRSVFPVLWAFTRSVCVCLIANTRVSSAHLWVCPYIDLLSSFTSLFFTNLSCSLSFQLVPRQFWWLLDDPTLAGLLVVHLFMCFIRRKNKSLCMWVFISWIASHLKCQTI